MDAQEEKKQRDISFASHALVCIGGMKSTPFFHMKFFLNAKNDELVRFAAHYNGHSRGLDDGTFPDWRRARS
jgi:hypothetical protein